MAADAAVEEGTLGGSGRAPTSPTAEPRPRRAADGRRRRRRRRRRGRSPSRADAATAADDAAAERARRPRPDASRGSAAAVRAILRRVPDRLPPPGPSFLREQRVEVARPPLRVGMSRPTTTDDGWWLAILWVADDDGSSRSSTSRRPPARRPEPPLARLGPSLAGALSGLILEDAGRLCDPPRDRRRRPTIRPARGASRPAVRAAFRWEPMRAAAMRPNELAETVLAAFRRSTEGLGRP